MSISVTFKSGKTVVYRDGNILERKEREYTILRRPPGSLGNQDTPLAFLPFENVERVDFVVPFYVHREWVRDDQLTSQLGVTIRKETERLARRLQRNTLKKYKRPKK